MDAGAVDEDGDVGDVDVGEAEVFDGGDTFVAGDRVFAHEAGVEDVEAEEAAGGAGDLEVGGGDVFDEGAAARAGLDVDGEGLGEGELAVADVDVADAAGGLAADADAGEDADGEGAVGDGDVFGGDERVDADLRIRRRKLGRGFGSAAGFEGDAVVAGGDVAVVDEDVLAGVDIDAVAVAAGGADGEVLDGDVAAERGVERPHEVVAGGEVFEAEIGAVDGFD